MWWPCHPQPVGGVVFITCLLTSFQMVKHNIPNDYTGPVLTSSHHHTSSPDLATSLIATHPLQLAGDMPVSPPQLSAVTAVPSEAAPAVLSFPETLQLLHKLSSHGLMSSKRGALLQPSSREVGGRDEDKAHLTDCTRGLLDRHRDPCPRVGSSTSGDVNSAAGEDGSGPASSRLASESKIVASPLPHTRKGPSRKQTLPSRSSRPSRQKWSAPLAPLRRTDSGRPSGGSAAAWAKRGTRRTLSSPTAPLLPQPRRQPPTALSRQRGVVVDLPANGHHQFHERAVSLVNRPKSVSPATMVLLGPPSPTVTPPVSVLPGSSLFPNNAAVHEDAEELLLSLNYPDARLARRRCRVDETTRLRRRYLHVQTSISPSRFQEVAPQLLSSGDGVYQYATRFSATSKRVRRRQQKTAELLTPFPVRTTPLEATGRFKRIRLGRTTHQATGQGGDRHRQATLYRRVFVNLVDSESEEGDTHCRHNGTAAAATHPVLPHRSSSFSQAPVESPIALLTSQPVNTSYLDDPLLLPTTSSPNGALLPLAGAQERGPDGGTEGSPLSPTPPIIRPATLAEYRGKPFVWYHRHNASRGGSFHRNPRWDLSLHLSPPHGGETAASRCPAMGSAGATPMERVPAVTVSRKPDTSALRYYGASSVSSSHGFPAPTAPQREEPSAKEEVQLATIPVLTKTTRRRKSSAAKEDATSVITHMTKSRRVGAAARARAKQLDGTSADVPGVPLACREVSPPLQETAGDIAAWRARLEAPLQQAELSVTLQRNMRHGTSMALGQLSHGTPCAVRNYVLTAADLTKCLEAVVQGRKGADAVATVLEASKEALADEPAAMMMVCEPLAQDTNGAGGGEMLSSFHSRMRTRQPSAGVPEESHTEPHASLSIDGILLDQLREELSAVFLPGSIEDMAPCGTSGGDDSQRTTSHGSSSSRTRSTRTSSTGSATPVITDRSGYPTLPTLGILVRSLLPTTEAVAKETAAALVQPWMRRRSRKQPAGGRRHNQFVSTALSEPTTNTDRRARLVSASTPMRQGAAAPQPSCHTCMSASTSSQLSERRPVHRKRNCTRGTEPIRSARSLINTAAESGASPVDVAVNSSQSRDAPLLSELPPDMPVLLISMAHPYIRQGNVRAVWSKNRLQHSVVEQEVLVRSVIRGVLERLRVLHQKLYRAHGSVKATNVFWTSHASEATGMCMDWGNQPDGAELTDSVAAEDELEREECPPSVNNDWAVHDERLVPVSPSIQTHSAAAPLFHRDLPGVNPERLAAAASPVEEVNGVNPNGSKNRRILAAQVLACATPCPKWSCVARRGGCSHQDITRDVLYALPEEDADSAGNSTTFDDPNANEVAAVSQQWGRSVVLTDNNYPRVEAALWSAIARALPLQQRAQQSSPLPTSRRVFNDGDKTVFSAALAQQTAGGSSSLFPVEVAEMPPPPECIIAERAGDANADGDVLALLQPQFRSSGGASTASMPPFRWVPNTITPKSMTSEATDVWQVGLLAIDLAEGRLPPWLNRQLVPTPALRQNCWSLRFALFVDRCLQSDPACRPSVQQLLEDPWFSAVLGPGPKWGRVRAASAPSPLMVMRTPTAGAAFERQCRRSTTSALGHGPGNGTYTATAAYEPSWSCKQDRTLPVCFTGSMDMLHAFHIVTRAGMAARSGLSTSTSLQRPRQTTGMPLLSAGTSKLLPTCSSETYGGPAALLSQRPFYLGDRADSSLYRNEDTLARTAGGAHLPGPGLASLGAVLTPSVGGGVARSGIADCGVMPQMPETGARGSRSRCRPASADPLSPSASSHAGVSEDEECLSPSVRKVCWGDVNYTPPLRQTRPMLRDPLAAGTTLLTEAAPRRSRSGAGPTSQADGAARPAQSRGPRQPPLPTDNAVLSRPLSMVGLVTVAVDACAAKARKDARMATVQQLHHGQGAAEVDPPGAVDEAEAMDLSSTDSYEQQLTNVVQAFLNLTEACPTAASVFVATLLQRLSRHPSHAARTQNLQAVLCEPGKEPWEVAESTAALGSGGVRATEAASSSNAAKDQLPDSSPSVFHSYEVCKWIAASQPLMDRVSL